MEREANIVVGSLLVLGFMLTACGSTNTAQLDVVATAVAATLTAVVSTPIATTISPTSAPPTPTATPVPPTPTPIVIDDLPVDGENGNLTLRGDRDTQEGRYVLLPRIPHDQVTNPMVFHGQIAMRVEVFDRQRGEQDGNGIQTVTFSISDNETGDVVYQNQETAAPIVCLAAMIRSARYSFSPKATSAGRMASQCTTVVTRPRS